jgi:hypothetical protein
VQPNTRCAPRVKKGRIIPSQSCLLAPVRNKLAQVHAACAFSYHSYVTGFFTAGSWSQQINLLFKLILLAFFQRSTLSFTLLLIHPLPFIPEQLATKPLRLFIKDLDPRLLL